MIGIRTKKAIQIPEIQIAAVQIHGLLQIGCRIREGKLFHSSIKNRVQLFERTSKQFSEKIQILSIQKWARRMRMPQLEINLKMRRMNYVNEIIK